MTDAAEMTLETKAELHFIAKLGTWADRNAVGRRTRLELLAGYLTGARKRKNWDGIDRETAIQAAMKGLRG